MVSIILLQMLYGTSVPINKFLLQFSSPLLLAAVRMVCGGAILWWYSKITGKRKIFFCPWLAAALYGKYVLKYTALAELPVANVVLMISLTPFMSAFCNRNLSSFQWGALLGGMGGVVLTLTSFPFSLSFFWAHILLGIAVGCHVFAMQIMQHYVKVHNISISVLSGIHTMVIGAAILVSSMVYEGLGVLGESTSFWGWFMVMVVLNNVVCHTWYLYLLKRYSVTLLVFTDYANVIASILYSRIFLKETVPVASWSGALIIGISLFMFYQQEVKEASVAL